MLINPDVKKRYKQLQLGVFSRKNSAFLAPLLCSLQIKYIEPKEINAPDWFIMGCDSDTLYINPDKLLTISFKDASFILEHELWHIARLHNKRRENRDPRLWNEACDHVINLAMIADGASCSIKGCANPRYTNMTEEEIYDILTSKNQLNTTSLNQSQSNSNHPSNPNVDPDYSQDLVKDNDQKQQANGLANVSKARQQAQMCQGLQPGTIAGSLTKLWEKVLSPKLPWEVILRNLMKEIVPKAKLSWKRRNRRVSKIHLPSMEPNKKKLGQLIYCIDTSGSVNNDQIDRINSEIKYIHDHLKPKLLTVIQFDHAIQDIKTFSNRDVYQNIELHGGGGTSYAPLKEYIDKLKIAPDGVVIFTDLYCRPMAPLNNESIPVFWVAVNTEMTKENIPFGEYIPVEI